MPEYTSVLKAERTPNGGATATLDGERSRWSRAILGQRRAGGREGRPPVVSRQQHRVACASRKAGPLTFKADPDSPLALSQTKLGKKLRIGNDGRGGIPQHRRRYSRSRSFVRRFRRPTHPRSCDGRQECDQIKKRSSRRNIVGDTYKFYDDEEHSPIDELSRWVPPPMGVPVSSTPAAIVSGIEESVAATGFGADLVSTKQSAERQLGNTASDRKY